MSYGLPRMNDLKANSLSKQLLFLKNIQRPQQESARMDDKKVESEAPSLPHYALASVMIQM
jgi:hypothetical protein